MDRNALREGYRYVDSLMIFFFILLRLPSYQSFQGGERQLGIIWHKLVGISFNFSCNNWQLGDVNKESVAQFSVGTRKGREKNIDSYSTRGHPVAS